MAVRFDRAASVLWNVDGRARGAKASDRARPAVRSEPKARFEARAGTSWVVHPGFDHEFP